MTADPMTGDPQPPTSLTSRLRAAVLDAETTTSPSAEAADTAAVYVRAYCSRLTEADDPPLVVVRVALHLAQRLTANPTALRDVSAEGQGVTYAPVGLLYLESLLLNSYRRRSA